MNQQLSRLPHTHQTIMKHYDVPISRAAMLDGFICFIVRIADDFVMSTI